MGRNLVPAFMDFLQSIGMAILAVLPDVVICKAICSSLGLTRLGRLVNIVIHKEVYKNEEQLLGLGRCTAAALLNTFFTITRGGTIGKYCAASSGGCPGLGTVAGLVAGRLAG
jgi:hypothetical protein